MIYITPHKKALGGALARVITIEYTAHATVPEGIALFPWVGWRRPPNEPGLVRRSPVGLVESQVWAVGHRERKRAGVKAEMRSYPVGKKNIWVKIKIS